MGKVSDRRPASTGPGSPAPSPEIVKLIGRVASFPRGLAFMDTGALECAAITFGVHPEVVLEARGYLATPASRAWFLEEVRRRQSPDLEPWHAPRPYAPSATPGPRTAAALVRAAEKHQYGVSFLLESPPETVAVVFHVHPQMVFRARALFARWSARRGTERSS
jgi:hypothetical protein